jgi:hypothetical protein
MGLRLGFFLGWGQSEFPWEQSLGSRCILLSSTLCGGAGRSDSLPSTLHTSIAVSCRLRG